MLIQMEVHSMDRTPVQSSNIVSIGYDNQTFVLEVEFNGGRIYQYFNVPDYIYNDLINSSSVGTYFNQNIKNGGYGFTQI
jgi:hypothetical protein